MLAKKECPIRLIGGRWFEVPMVAMFSGNGGMSGFVGPVGCHERASTALCHTPGIWIMGNLYRSVFSFRFLS